MFNAVFAQEIQQIPARQGVVTDLTTTLSTAEIEKLETIITEFEYLHGSQIAVLIIDTTKPETIEEFSMRLAETWQTGREKIDDGVILLIAKDDKKVRIEVGYGLEGAIPDIYAKRIIENVIVPQFRQGKFYSGISEGINSVITLINKEELPAVTTQLESNDIKSAMFTLIGIGLIIAIFIINAKVKSDKTKIIIALVLGLTLILVSGSIVGGIVAFLLIGALFVFDIKGAMRGSHTGSSRGSYGGGGSFGGGGASGGW